MKDNLKSIIIALAIFCAGLVTGILTQFPRSVYSSSKDFGGFPPPPDFHAMQEFGRGEHEEGRGRRDHFPPPEIRAYEEKIQGILDVYRGKIREVLTPAQKSAFDKIVEEHMLMPKPADVEFRVNPPPHNMPPVGPLRFVGIIIYRPLLEHLTHELKLDEKQKVSIQKIMEERRAELLKFVDTTPPPTLRMTLKGDEPQQPPRPDRKPQE